MKTITAAVMAALLVTAGFAPLAANGALADGIRLAQDDDGSPQQPDNAFSDAPIEDQMAPSGGIDSVTAHCEVGDCYFCDDVRLNVEGGPSGTNFSGNGEGGYVTISSNGGGLAGEYTLSCSWRHNDQPQGCTATVNISGSNRNVFMQASSTNCEYTAVNEH